MDTAAKLEEELLTLERDWQRQRETFLVLGKDGKLSEPTGASLVPRVIIMVGSVVVMAFLSATSLPTAFVYLLLIPFSLATFQLLSGAGKSEAFDRARSIYESHRTSLIRRLEKAREIPG
jgi:hypothetical protein